MKMVIVSVIVAVLLLGGIAWYASSQGSNAPVVAPSNAGTLVAKDDVSASGTANAAETAGLSAAGSSSNVPATQVRVINVKASKFMYNPGTITVKKGGRVNLVIDNSDTTHGIVIPDLSVSGIGSVEFTADKAGTFEFRCPTMCGSGHKDMKGTLIVEE